MGSLTVTMVQADGVVRTLENLEPGQSLMQAAKANGVAGIAADCNGRCDCGTCHVHVAPEWLAAVGQPDDVEMNVLGLAEGAQDNSRLSCQIKLRPELDGLTVSVVNS